MKIVALISAVLEFPEEQQTAFNKIVSAHKHMIKGRMGLPLEDYGVAAIAIVAAGTADEINSFTGKLGSLPNVRVKTTISQKKERANI